MTEIISRPIPGSAPAGAAPDQAEAASPAAARPSRPDEVSVNGVTISRAAIAREIQNHRAKTPKDAFHAAARALVVRELLLAEARRLAIAAAPEADADGCRETADEALIRALLELEVRVPTADTETCRRYFEQNRRLFHTGDLFEASHILFAAAPDDAAGRREARAEAAAVAETLRSGAATFEAMARAHSACPSRETGGSLGQIGPGQTVSEFETALAALVPGATVPEPVESRYGIHLVRVARRIAGRDLPFEMVESAIAARLEDTAWRTAMRQYVGLLAGRADIRGVAMDGATSPLVQ
mgnify:CR=1 FL=1